MIMVISVVVLACWSKQSAFTAKSLVSVCLSVRIHVNNLDMITRPYSLLQFVTWMKTVFVNGNVRVTCRMRVDVGIQTQIENFLKKKRVKGFWL